MCVSHPTVQRPVCVCVCMFVSHPTIERPRCVCVSHPKVEIPMVSVSVCHPTVEGPVRECLCVCVFVSHPIVPYRPLSYVSV